jgi:murein L,D-transpeptidase YafK
MKCRLSTVLLLAGLLNVVIANGCNRPQTTDNTGTNKNKFLLKKLDQPVDSILVVKKYRHMYVFNKGKLLKVYNVSLGTVPIGHKHFQGDFKTPEGLYRIVHKNPYSQAHKSLAISYPNDNDRRYAKKHGKPTGGDVMIHGLWNGWSDDDETDYSKEDWTWGCIAVKNLEIDELYDQVILGCPINILP